MIKERKANPGKAGEENLLDCIISYSDDEEIQFADALQFSAAGQNTLDYCKIYVYLSVCLSSFHLLVAVHGLKKNIYI